MKNKIKKELSIYRKNAELLEFFIKMRNKIHQKQLHNFINQLKVPTHFKSMIQNKLTLTKKI